MSSTLSVSMDDLDELIGNIPMGKAITNSMYGVNRGQTIAPIPGPDNTTNRIFITRPQLNMRAYNILTDKLYGMLINSDPKSMQSAIRSILDPRLHYKYNGMASTTMVHEFEEVLKCPIVDHRSPWMNILSNTLVSLDGWIDLSMGKAISAPDRLKGTVEQIDDTDVINNSTSFSATFTTMRGDINRLLLYYMYRWQSKVLMKEVSRYPDLHVAKCRDYNTRFTSILTGNNDEDIVNWATTGPAFVTNVNFSSRFNFKRGNKLAEEDREFSAEFSAYGMRYDEVISLQDFNLTTSYFHKGMQSGTSIKRTMKQVDHEERHLFEHRAYPLVDLKRMKLLWFVDKAYYDAKINTLKRKGLLYEAKNI